jgi:predicted DsbA family dithiol-disulfide isomerase
LLREVEGRDQAVSGQAGPVQVEVWSDVACPWCYVGSRRLEAAIEQTGLAVDVVYRAFELDPNVPPDGPPLAEYLERKFGDRSRVQAAHARLTSAGVELGIDFRWSQMKRANTFDAHRLIVWALRGGGPAAQGRMKRALLQAYFTDGRDVADRSVLAEVAATAGFDHAEVVEVLASDAEAGTVRAEEAAAHQNGIAAVPTFVIEGRWMLQGAMETDKWVRALPRLQAELDAERAD